MDQVSDQEIRDYRQHFVLAEQKAQEDYDKAVLALSGGGRRLLPQCARLCDLPKDGHDYF